MHIDLDRQQKSVNLLQKSADGQNVKSFSCPRTGSLGSVRVDWVSTGVNANIYRFVAAAPKYSQLGGKGMQDMKVGFAMVCICLNSKKSSLDIGKIVI